MVTSASHRSLLSMRDARPQSAQSAAGRMDVYSPASAAAASADVLKVFSNSLYDAGDIVAGLEHAKQLQQQPPPSRAGGHLAQLPGMPTPPMSPMAASGSLKLQQQRLLAAQKRMERLQMGGLAQSNDTVAVVTLSTSRPGTPKTVAGLARQPQQHQAPAQPAAAPPPGAPSGARPFWPNKAGSSGGGSGGGMGATDGGCAMQGGPRLAARPAEGSCSMQGGGRASSFHPDSDDSDLEVETLDEPVQPGTASAANTGAGALAGGGAAPSAGGAILKQPQQPAALDLSDLGAFLRRPAPPASAGVVMCCIERLQSSMGKPPTYRFHLELPKGGYRFLLAARKRIKSATSTYVISTSADDLSRHSRHCVAKLRSNLLGTAFTVVTSGGGSNCSSTGSSRPASGVAGARPATQPHQQQLAVSRAGVAVPQQQQQQQQQQQHLARQRSSGGTAVGQRSGRERDGSNAWQQQQQPGDAPAASAAHGGAKCELGAVLYETNVLGTRGPRRMSAAVPAADASGASLWLPAAGAAQDSIADRLRMGECEGLVVLRNKAPKWNEALNAYCLNFNGRVTEASVKNFQLVAAGDDGVVPVLQFGKVSDTTFTCDFTAPLSPLVAFAMCLSSFDNKLACE